MDIIITVPKTVKWEDYLKEVEAVADRSQVMNFKVPTLPKRCRVGDRCYVAHNGEVKGWMEIVGFEENDFTCTTTGKVWKGKFVVRSGPFYDLTKNPLHEPVKMNGFQGFRYYDSGF